jgi:hypothetical protein
MEEPNEDYRGEKSVSDVIKSPHGAVDSHFLLLSRDSFSPTKDCLVRLAESTVGIS